jgi:hypothetical protein
MTTYTLMLPKLVGIRESVTNLVATIPEGTTDVVVDFSDNKAMSQSACDQLVKDIMVNQKFNSMTCVNNSELSAQYLRMAQVLRDIAPERVVLS